jgi:hypothetical protein
MKRIQVIIPKKLLPDGKAVARVLKNASRMAGEQLRADFEATTNTWSKRPDFKREDIGIGSVEVSTENFIWILLDAGTKPHVITPKRGKFLRFAWDGFGSYGAKTKPNSLSSRNAKYPKRVVFRRRVRHPGTAPRNWVETARKKWESKWPDTVQRALRVEEMMRNQ